MTSDERILPTGTCWCGCGGDTAIGKFFLQGHDKAAEGAILALLYDSSIPRMLQEHGYGPDNPVTEAAVQKGVWLECSTCQYAASPRNMRKHKKESPRC